jgi:hypothetical protein
MVYVCMRGIRCILIREGYGCVHMRAWVYVGGMGCMCMRHSCIVHGDMCEWYDCVDVCVHEAWVYLCGEQVRMFTHVWYVCVILMCAVTMGANPCVSAVLIANYTCLYCTTNIIINNVMCV